MTSSQASAAATRVGVAVEIISSEQKLLETAEQATPKLIVIDLSHPGLEIDALVPRLKSLAPEAPVLAFGPHVHKERLAAAAEAGCEQVVSRGQFLANVDAVLRAAQ
jgi:CheY-like chemotaxis protein